MDKNKKTKIILISVLVVVIIAIVAMVLVFMNKGKSSNNPNNNSNQNGENNGGNGNSGNNGENGSSGNNGGSGNGSSGNNGENGSSGNNGGNGNGSSGNSGGSGNGSSGNNGGSGNGSSGNNGGSGNGSSGNNGGNSGNNGGSNGSTTKLQFKNFSCRKAYDEDGIRIADSIKVRYQVGNGVLSDETIRTVSAIDATGQADLSYVVEDYRNWIEKLGKVKGFTAKYVPSGEKHVFTVKTDYTKADFSKISYEYQENEGDDVLHAFNDIRKTDTLELITEYFNVSGYTCQISEG